MIAAIIVYLVIFTGVALSAGRAGYLAAMRKVDHRCAEAFAIGFRKGLRSRLQSDGMCQVGGDVISGPAKVPPLTVISPVGKRA